MTHTLHRVLELTENNFDNDIVVMMMAAKGFNKDQSAENKKEFLRIVSNFDPVNFGEGVKLQLPDKLKEKMYNFLMKSSKLLMMILLQQQPLITLRKLRD